MTTASETRETQTSLEKALDLCEALAGVQQGLSVSELARRVRQPAPTVHRLLAVLKRRGFVRQDEDTFRYGLTLKMLDLSFRVLGRSELRLLDCGHTPMVEVPRAYEQAVLRLCQMVEEASS